MFRVIMKHMKKATYFQVSADQPRIPEISYLGNMLSSSRSAARPRSIRCYQQASHYRYFDGLAIPKSLLKCIDKLIRRYSASLILWYFQCHGKTKGIPRRFLSDTTATPKDYHSNPAATIRQYKYNWWTYMLISWWNLMNFISKRYRKTLWK